MATAKKEEKEPPRITARTRGLYHDLLQGTLEEFERKNPGKKGRWVRLPEDKHDNSQLLRRRAMGYEIVSASDAGIESRHGETGDMVRVGDVVLMAIDAKIRDQIEAELAFDAREEVRRVQNQFYQDVEGQTAGNHQGHATGQIDMTYERPTGG